MDRMLRRARSFIQPSIYCTRSFSPALTNEPCLAADSCALPTGTAFVLQPTWNTRQELSRMDLQMGEYLGGESRN